MAFDAEHFRAKLAEQWTPEKVRLRHIQYYLSSKSNPTCISNWFPKIQKGLPHIKMPETHFCYISMDERALILDGKPTGKSWDETVEKLTIAADKVGYPAFMKDGVFSGKHEWSDTCFIQSKDDISKHLRRLIYFQGCVGCIDSQFIVMRQFLKTIAPFTAFGGMPVTCERRYFAEDGNTFFHHPYWPPFTIENPSIEKWEPLLEKLNEETDEEIEMLSALSSEVSKLLGGAWSIDWLKDADGNWWLTDMALANQSFCWREYVRP